MKISFLSQLPKLELSPMSDWCVYSHRNNEQQLNYLCYAVERDYLSTPRTFAILSFQGNKNCAAHYSEFERQNYFEQSGIDNSGIAMGFYQWNKSSNTSELSVILLVLEDEVVEIECESYSVVETLYHWSNSQSALSEFVDNLS